MMILLVLLVVLATTQAKIIVDKFDYGTWEYLSVNDRVDVLDAEKTCKKWGMKLTSIHSKQENEHIRKHIRTGDAWIGITDKDREGKYVNFDGTPIDFTYYARGEPNNVRNEDYTLMSARDGRWWDYGTKRRKFGFVCKRIRVEEKIPKNLSCFDNFRFWQTKDCSKSGKSNNYRTITSGGYHMFEFCISAFRTVLSTNKILPYSNTYIFSMTLQSIKEFLNKNENGHVGVAFNIKDDKHFDFIYFRIHTPRNCFSLGYVEGLRVQIASTGNCSELYMKSQDDVIVNVNVNGYNTKIHADGILIKSYHSRYPGLNRAAALTRNGKHFHDNTIGFKNTKVCQAVQCKLQVKNKLVSLAYGERIRTKKCEMCQCQKFGQIKCQCDSQAHIKCRGDELEQRDKDCCKTCIPKPRECVVWGDPHYTTFDNIPHNFQGACKYVLVKTADFKIHHGNEKRPESGSTVSYTKEVMVEFRNKEYSLRKGHIFAVDDRQKVLPYRELFKEEFIIDVRLVGGENTYFKLLKDNTEMLLVKWNGDSRVSIVLNGVYKGTTQGLCGTWNSNRKDEYTTRSGFITTDVNVFGNSWKARDDQFCPDPAPPPHVCDDQPDLWKIARRVCSRIKGGQFTECNRKVDYTTYHKNCLIDVCQCFGDTACGCATAVSYSDECARHGIDVPKWRSKDFCPLSCEVGLMYNHCGSECTKTCAEPDPDCDPKKCVEGCFCPEGKVFFEDKCIDPKECVCIWKGEIRDVGDVWDNDEKCQSCTCADKGKVLCKSTICETCPKDHVPVVVDKKECCPVCVNGWLLPHKNKKEFNANVGESVTFGVSVHLPVKIPRSSFNWKKMSLHSTNLSGKKYEITENGKTLTIKDLSLQDEGTYRVTVCVDKNNCGSVEFKLSVAQTFLIPVDQHQKVRALESVMFGVIVNVEPQPKYKALMWFFEKVKLLPSKSKQIESENDRRKINIKNVMPANAGKYQCTLTLKDGSFYTVQFVLEVESKDLDILKPVQTPVVAVHSSNPTLVVISDVKNIPASAFSWYRNGKMINTAKNSHYQYRNNGKGLLIKRVSGTDSGFYTLKLNYKQIEASTKVELKVTAESVIIRTENSPLRTVVGQNANFLISIDSATKVPWRSVQWYRLDGSGRRMLRITPPKARSRYNTPQKRRKFTISRVVKEDAGFYEVVVQHKGSNVSAKVRLIVRDKRRVG